MTPEEIEQEQLKAAERFVAEHRPKDSDLPPDPREGLEPEPEPGGGDEAGDTAETTEEEPQGYAAEGGGESEDTPSPPTPETSAGQDEDEAYKAWERWKSKHGTRQSIEQELEQLRAQNQ